MNYKSQLKGWAIDRAIELSKANNAKLNMTQLMDQADQLAAYAYVPEKEFQDCISVISQILKESPDALAKINQLQAELGVIEEDIQRQSAVRNVGNANHVGAH
jgi:hypothetical protein